jgi:hypothetical protein
MNTNVLKVGACILWAGVALSSAASANALAVTTQVGSYAACSATSTASARQWCFDSSQKINLVHTSYTQNIKLVSQACNAGNCQPDASTVYTTQVYPTGRKTATDVTFDTCEFGGSNHYYQLGSCAC